MPSDFYSSFGPWLLHGFARTESYSISLNEDSSLELELISIKCNEDKELSFPSIRHTPFRYKLLCEKFQQTIYFRMFHVKKVSIQGPYPQGEKGGLDPGGRPRQSQREAPGTDSETLVSRLDNLVLS